MPILVNEKYTFNMSFPGLPPIYGNHTTLLSEYKINDPDFNYEFTKNIQTEKLVPEKEASELWDNNQQIVLTQREIKGAARVDSIMENASFIPKSILWLMQRGFSGFPDLPITSFNDFYHFNRTEGHYAGVGLKFDNLLSGTNMFIKTGYGFSDKKTKYDFKLEHKYKWITGYAEIFNRLSKLNRFYEYSDFDITFQSWFDKNDYADYYYSKGVAAGLGFQVHENILLGLNFQKRKDKNAFINSDWSLFNRKASYRPAVRIDEGDITELTFDLNYDNKNYYDLGFIKLPDQTKNYLDLNLKITRGYYSSSFSGYYWQFYFAFNGRNKLSSWIDPSYSFKGVLNNGLKLQQNLYHLRGDYGTIPTKFLFNTLKNNEYIGDKFASIILENNFGNVIYKLLGIPYMKDNKYDLIIFGKYGWINEDPLVHNSKSIYETGIGIGNILSFLRIDFAWRLQPHSKSIFYINLVSMYDM